MAEAVVPEPSREQASRAEEPLPRFERQQAVHGGRFMVGYAVIVVMVLAALLTIGFMSRGDDSSSTAAAGGLTTEEGGFQRAREIATEIARQYRGANGEQLVAVTAQTGEVSGLPLQYIALRHGRNRQLTQGDVSVVQPGETALFSFCGLAGEQNCALPGQPTPRAPDAAAPRGGRAVVLHLQAPAGDPDRRLAVPAGAAWRGPAATDVRRVLPAQAHGGPPRRRPHQGASRRSRRSPTET